MIALALGLHSTGIVTGLAIGDVIGLLTGGPPAPNLLGKQGTPATVLGELRLGNSSGLEPR